MQSPRGQTLRERLERLAAIFQDPQSRFPRRTFLASAGAGAVIASLPLTPFGLGIASAASGRTLNIVAHEDDDLLFLSPDLLHNIQAGRVVRTVYVTSGDAGDGTAYWQDRQSGEEAAYALMGGVANSWTQTDAGISGHPMPLYTLTANPNISLVFMHIPDGNIDGSGFAATGNVSLQDLWTGSISSITTVDGSSTYAKAGLVNTLTSLMTAFQPDQVNTQDYVGTYGDGDHSDHHTVAYMTQSAVQNYATTHTFTGYQDYGTSDLPANITGADLTAKQNAFYAYGNDDQFVCNSKSSCSGGSYALWLQRQYTVSGGSGGGNGQEPVANAGSDQTVNINTTVQLDGSGNADPNGQTLTYQWTQLSGTTVTLSSATVVKPTFTAPSSSTNLTFQLVVNNGQASSTPAVVTIAVAGKPIANAGPAQTVGINSPVQLDGSASSANGGLSLTYQWTQVGGPAVTLSSGTSVQPTFKTPSSATTLTFQLVVNDGAMASDPTTVAVKVFASSGNYALLATATASSSVSGQTPNKVIDGVIDGYPGDSTKEWSTNGGGAGSWLKLTWTAAQTANLIVLYDRPNANDQITAGNLQFSDGTSITIGALNNNGTATGFSFATKTITTLQLNITSVSGTTENIGLAEIQVFGPNSGTQLPVASAGSNQTVMTSATVQLDGSGSSDPNGHALTYQWTQTAGPTVTLSSPTAVQPTFTAPSSTAVLTFQLVVNNGQVNSNPSSVTINVASVPVANAGPNQTVGGSSPVQLDGSASSDSDGNPLTYQWSQVAGPTVTLSSTSAVQPTFTTPASATTLTFHLVVVDGALSSVPATVNVTVNASSADLALSATATASSQSTANSQTANKAIDGVVTGYPGDYTKEWATNGGGAGSWLKLTWTTAQTVSRVVLYDRPNLNDQITGGNLQFSDGSSVAVGALNNNGTATTVTFAAKVITTLQLNITSVSSTTQNVGLSEIQVYAS